MRVDKHIKLADLHDYLTGGDFLNKVIGVRTNNFDTDLCDLIILVMPLNGNVDYPPRFLNKMNRADDLSAFSKTVDALGTSSSAQALITILKTIFGDATHITAAGNINSLAWGYVFKERIVLMANAVKSSHWPSLVCMRSEFKFVTKEVEGKHYMVTHSAIDNHDNQTVPELSFDGEKNRQSLMDYVEKVRVLSAKHYARVAKNTADRTLEEEDWKFLESLIKEQRIQIDPIYAIKEEFLQKEIEAGQRLAFLSFHNRVWARLTDMRWCLEADDGKVSLFHKGLDDVKSTISEAIRAIHEHDLETFGKVDRRMATFLLSAYYWIYADNSANFEELVSEYNDMVIGNVPDALELEEKSLETFAFIKEELMGLLPFDGFTQKLYVGCKPSTKIRHRSASRPAYALDNLLIDNLGMK